MTKIIQNADFTNKNIYVGLDVHKSNWAVTIYYEQTYLKKFTQPPSPEALAKFLHKEYPGATCLCGYESGFSGFWIQRELVQKGINCYVIHAADLPQTNKRKATKNDTVDSLCMAQALSAGTVHSIYIPDPVTESHRSLLRYRDKLIKDIKRCKNRIRSMLLYLGVNVPAQFTTGWSKRFVAWLRSFEVCQSVSRTTLDHMIDELELLRSSLLKVNKDIRLLQKDPKYSSLLSSLTSTPGIGPLSALILLTEIDDIRRFSSFRKLNSFVGLYPMEYSSGEHVYTGKITTRSNAYLRKILIEAAWIAIRHDPALLQVFNMFKDKMSSKRAIVKIARKLLSRIRHIWLNETLYVKGLIR